MQPPPLDRLRARVDALLVGQDDARTGCLLGLLAGRSVLLEGPPGCGKTALAEGVALAAGEPRALLGFHGGTRADDVLGASVLRRTPWGSGDRLSLERATTALDTAQSWVLDDLSRAPVATLLAVLRRVGSSGSFAIATLLAAGPDDVDEGLSTGLLDVFAVQVRMRGLLAAGSPATAAALLARAAAAVPVRSTAEVAAIDTGECRLLRATTARVVLSPPLRDALVALGLRLGGLRTPEAEVCFGDRALGFAVGLVRAHAALRGAAVAAPRDLAAVRFLLGRRAPDSLRVLAEEIVDDAARGAFVRTAARAVPRPGAAHPAATAGPPPAREPAASPPGTGSPAIAAPSRGHATADVRPLLRALDGRLEPGRVDRRDDPGGAPRRVARMTAFDELEEADPVELGLLVEGVLVGPPRVMRRQGRRAAGALALLRDVSASMEGDAGRAASQVLAGVVRLAARRRMRIGYLEFHHAAEPLHAEGAFFHRRYGRLLALAARPRAEGRTSYEAPLRAALAAFGAAPGAGRHAVLLTDGVPVLGDPQVVRERALARRLGVRVHTVFLGAAEPPPVLLRLARETGGLAFALAPDAGERWRVRRAA